MSEIRHDKILDIWSIIAPIRRRRPAMQALGRAGSVASAPATDCPFCPGNDDLLPSIIAETPRRDLPGWQTRVVPNKYPVVEQAIVAASIQSEAYEVLPGVGRHEVIIEHPDHKEDLATMSRLDILTVLDTYRMRHTALMADPAIESVTIFRNRGPNAGASIRHPHSQIIGLTIEPPLVRDRAARARCYYEAQGQCPFCDMLARERDEGSRVVYESSQFVALVPFAAIASFEVWLIPLVHRAGFDVATEAELRDLAEVLHRVLDAYRARLGDPEYNLAIHTAPRTLEKEPYLHWFVQILPRLTKAAGFDLGSGIVVNPSIPEEDAVLLAASTPDSDSPGGCRANAPPAQIDARGLSD